MKMTMMTRQHELHTVHTYLFIYSFSGGKPTNKPDPELRTEKQTHNTEEYPRRY